MAATNNKTSIAELDFDNIKTNLKTYLQGQTEFSDYNFEGSGLSVILDILSYNTHYNALYTNLAINEMFLDSASKRDSIISIANNYGYLPRSYRAAVANITLSVNVGQSTAQTITIPKFTPFLSSVGTSTYMFYNNVELTGNKLSDAYVFEPFNIYEGTAVTEKFNVLEGTQYILQNTQIDTSTIKIYVQDAANALTVDSYQYAESIIGLNNTSKVFFVREIEGGLYEIRFGKNNLGAEPPVGAVVTIEYIVTNGSAANGMKLFSYSGATLANTPQIVVNSIAAGGQEAETNDEIRYNVPRKFRSQNRAVTAEDYVDIIKANYSDIDSINCWSGDELTPPEYGKILVSIKPKSGPFLIPSEKKNIIENIIKPRAVLGVYPKIIDPIYNNIVVDCSFYYNPAETNKSAIELTNIVRNTILDYNNANLKQFGGILRFSNLTSDIDASDRAIKNNITTIKLRRSLDIIFGSYYKYVIEMNNPIYDSGVPEEAILTNGFYLDNSGKVYYIDDDGLGKLRLFYYSVDTYKKVFVDSNYGSVDYVSGVITINNMKVLGTVESNLDFIIIPHSNDILSKHNQISLMDENRLNVTAVKETRLATRTFTNSR